jgi:NAD(P)-dependent dehydrogenase (short-subunit alcohol dehydrogenase family)
MNINLNGKTALVTGSTAGIGFAIAHSLAESGARVYINGRTEIRVTQAIQKLRSLLPKADIQGIAADVGTAKGTETLCSQLKEVDILINNAGIFEPKPFFEIPDSDWQRFFDVNVMSAVRLSRYYTPAMVKKNWGRVIFISSESAVQIPTEMVHYGMTKTALLAVSRGLAETVAATGVTVNAVLPGPTKSEGVTDFIKKMTSGTNKTFESVEQEFFKSARPTSLIKRFATPEEVANMVTYIASKEASATTGAALRVDGGVVKSIF